MITIKASIDIGGTGTVNSSNTVANGENTTNVSSFSSILGQNNPKLINNGFTLGKTKLGSGAKYVKEIPYVVGRYLSNINGYFDTPYQIGIASRIPNIPLAGRGIVLSFDKENAAHPKSITVKFIYASGTEETRVIYDDDASFELPFPEDVRILGVAITIDTWNKPNSPFILSGIYAIGDFEINSDNLISFEDDILDRSNVEYPNYGLISNSGSLVFIDFDRTAFDLITKRILTADKLTTVWIDNTTENIEEQICKMSIQSMTYNNDNLQVNMQLKDNLEKMQDITVEGLYVDPSNPQPQTAKWYYEKLYQYTIDAGFDILTFDELDSDTKTVLYNTNIEYPLLDSDTLWNEWTKICELCLCHMYIDNNNKVVLKYSGGN